MIKEIVMPKLGQTVEEAILERWLKKEGDLVKKGDVLLEITTDKATLEVEAFVEGTLRKILVQEGETVPVNTVIAFVGDLKDPIPHVAPSSLTQAVVHSNSDTSSISAAFLQDSSSKPTDESNFSNIDRIFISPRARKRSAELYVPIGCLKGSGPNGRIIEKDVLEYAQKRKQIKITPLARQLAYKKNIDVLSLEGIGDSRRIKRKDIERAESKNHQTILKHVSLTPMRRIIAERMTLSQSTVPHFYLDMEVEMDAATIFRKQMNDLEEVKISYSDMIVKACVLAFQENPEVNFNWGDETLISREKIDIGLAVAVKGGLLVPILKNLDPQSLADIARQRTTLVEKTRTHRLTPDDYGVASMTVSNLGMYGVQRVFPIINPGESCILGVGGIEEKAVARNGSIQIRNMMSLILAGDHRVIDGALGAQFLKKIKEVLEEPSLLEK